MIHKEAEFQDRAARAGIAPRVLDVNTVLKYIVMEKLDIQLIDIITKRRGVLNQTVLNQLLVKVISV